MLYVYYNVNHNFVYYNTELRENNLFFANHLVHLCLALSMEWNVAFVKNNAHFNYTEHLNETILSGKAEQKACFYCLCIQANIRKAVNQMLS